MSRIVLLGVVALGGCDAGSPPRLDPAADAARGEDADPGTDARILDATVTPDTEVPPDADPCAVPSHGDWVGTASRGRDGGGNGSVLVVSANVHWTLASTADCVDRYTPSGTATYFYEGHCHYTYDPPTAAIAASDGQLILDRRMSPATWRAMGTTTWSAVETCDTDTFDVTAGGQWIDALGVMNGPVIDGVVRADTDVPEIELAWHFRPDGMAFPPPAECVEPPRDTWTFGGEITSTSTQAAVTWTRVSTVGCTDTFTPSGTARLIPFDVGACEEFTMGPTTAPIEADDGTLVVDRATNPPTFVVRGQTTWAGTSTCRFDDGHTETTSHTWGGDWALFEGAYAGDQPGGTSGYLGSWWSWRFGGEPGELP